MTISPPTKHCEIRWRHLTSIMISHKKKKKITLVDCASCTPEDGKKQFPDDPVKIKDSQIHYVNTQMYSVGLTDIIEIVLDFLFIMNR